eukprot:jgi/Tetstr1/448756/TSEL_035991.t1
MGITLRAASSPTMTARPLCQPPAAASVRAGQPLAPRPALVHRPLLQRSALQPACIPTRPGGARLPARATRGMKVSASSTAPVVAAAESAPTEGWKGAKLGAAAASIAVGLVIRFVVPIPGGLDAQAWSLFSIFVATIVGLVAEPLPTGAWAMLGVTCAIVTKTLTFNQAFGAFCNEVIWLIVASFFFARGLEKTGLGNRIAQLFVKTLGKSTMGLAYGLGLAEVAISPAMPSTSARMGGIFMPIIKSLAEAAGSLPGKTAKKMGAFLIVSQMQFSNSPMFLTAAAQNLLCLKLAAEMGIVVNNAWMTWFIGASVPSALMLLLTPLLAFKLMPPELQDTPEAPAQAEKALQAMGPMSTDEKIMAATMAGAVALWVGGAAIGVSSVAAALLGLGLLLFTGVLTWKDCLTNTSAWDTLFWFAILVGMSGQLNAMGVIGCFADAAGGVLQSMSLSWPVVFGILHAMFFLIHYAFASQTAHVGALFSAFVAMMLAAGVPPVLAVLTLGYNANLFGVINHYSSGQAAIFCGAGYLELKEVFRVGAVFALFHAVLWATVGMAWFKIVGLY